MTAYTRLIAASTFAVPLFLLSGCGDDSPKPAGTEPPKPAMSVPPGQVPAKPAAEAPPPPPDPDRQLARRVAQELELQKVHAGGVDVTAKGGVVSLWGTVSSDDERLRAAKIAQGVAGVKSVDNKIVVVRGS